MLDTVCALEAWTGKLESALRDATEGLGPTDRPGREEQARLCVAARGVVLLVDALDPVAVDHCRRYVDDRWPTGLREAAEDLAADCAEPDVVAGADLLEWRRDVLRGLIATRRLVKSLGTRAEIEGSNGPSADDAKPVWPESILSSLRRNQRVLAEMMNEMGGEVAIGELADRCGFEMPDDNANGLVRRFNAKLKELGDTRRVHRHNGMIRQKKSETT